MDHRVVTSAVQVAVRALRVTPAGSVHLSPPFGAHHAPGLIEVVGKVPGEYERPAVVLGEGPVAGFVDEGRELGCCHRCGRDGEWGQVHGPHRALTVRRVGLHLIAHKEGSPR